MLTNEQIVTTYAMLAINARPVDVEMVLALGGTEQAMAEYIWDHLLGEPDSPTEGQILDVIKLVHANDIDEQAVARELDAAGDAEMAGTLDTYRVMRARVLVLRFPEIANEAAGSEPGGGPVR